jgi:hypothetical protein
MATLVSQLLQVGGEAESLSTALLNGTSNKKESYGTNNQKESSQFPRQNNYLL